MFTENLGLKIISLLMAIFIWVQSVLMAEHRSVISLPVVLKNLPKNLTLERLPHSIPFSVRGRGMEILKLKLSRTKVDIDAAKLKPGFELISTNDWTIDLPENIDLTLIGPVEKQQIAVQADVFHQKKVPVVLAFADNNSRLRFSTLNYQIIPPSVLIFGPKRKVQLIEQVATEPVSREMTGTQEFNLNIGQLEDEVSVSEKQVKIRISTSYVATKVYDSIPISSVAGKSAVPAKVTVKLSGDSDLLKDFDPTQIKVSVDGNADAQGFYALRVEVPPSLSAVAVTPNKVRLR